MRTRLGSDERGRRHVCGIVGLRLKTPGLRPRLGELLAGMLDCMSSRGPDSAGLAVYTEPTEGTLRLSLRDAGRDWDELGERLAAELGGAVGVRPFGDAATLQVPGDPGRVLAALRNIAPGAVLVGHGRAMEVVKEVGAARDVCRRYAISDRAGYQGIGHTRMATESAVTTDHSHPFAPYLDLALVHNGSFANHATVRRRLQQSGVQCVTDNDSEVAARFVGHQLSAGADLSDALRMVGKEFDGFFTLLVSTRTQFAVLRDSFACKPAVIAETADYVAVASEYHALAELPGIADARVFEPVPEEVYAWSR